MGQAHARLTRQLVGSGIELGIDQASSLDVDRLKPFDDQSQDYVVANDVIGRVANPLGLLDEIHRVLRPGGTAVLLLPDRTTASTKVGPPTSLRHVVDHFEKQATDIDDHSVQAHCWQPDEFAEVLQYAIDEFGHQWDAVDREDEGPGFAFVLRRAAAAGGDNHDSHRLNDAGRLYGRWYYDHALGVSYRDHDHWMSFFGQVADNIVRQLEPRTVLDAGCAKGYLVAALRERGVAAHGFDISEIAINEAVEGARGHLSVGSLTAPIDECYDLVTCVEVIEHLDPADTATAVANLCQATDRVLLCSTPHDLAEVTHTNVRQPEQWSQAFAAHGFFRDFRHDATYLTPWAALYRRDRKTTTEVVIDYDREWARLRAETIEQRKALLHLHNDLERVGNELERLGHELARADDDRQRLNEILASRSWRLARAIAKPVGMLRRPPRS